MTDSDAFASLLSAVISRISSSVRDRSKKAPVQRDRRVATHLRNQASSTATS